MKAIKQIGEILLEAGVINQEKLDKALVEQKRWGGRLGKILLELGFISKEMLLETLSAQLGLEIIDFKKTKIGEKILKLLPKEFILKNYFVPFDTFHEYLYCGVPFMPEDEVLRKAEFFSKMKIKLFLAGEYDIEKIFEVYFDAGDLKEMKLRKELYPVIEDLLNKEDAPLYMRESYDKNTFVFLEIQLKKIFSLFQQLPFEEKKKLMRSDSKLKSLIELLIQKALLKSSVRNFIEKLTEQETKESLVSIDLEENKKSLEEETSVLLKFLIKRGIIAKSDFLKKSMGKE